MSRPHHRRHENPMCSINPHTLRRLSASRVVLMCGISGSGKTAFATALQSRGYVRVAADVLLWEKYGADFPRLPASVRAQAFCAIGAMLAQALRPHLAARHKVVVDATMCRREKRRELTELCRQYGIVPLTVYLKASPSLLAERLKHRRGTGPDDQLVTPDELRRYCSGFEPPAPDEPHIVIEQK